MAKHISLTIAVIVAIIGAYPVATAFGGGDGSPPEVQREELELGDCWSLL